MGWFMSHLSEHGIAQVIPWFYLLVKIVSKSTPPDSTFMFDSSSSFLAIVGLDYHYNFIVSLLFSFR